MTFHVLVACEESGRVRDAYNALPDTVAWSCDLMPTDHGGPHHQGDVRELLTPNPDGTPRWDLMIAHPPCTYLSRSAARWLTQTPANPKPGVLYGEARQAAQRDAVDFVRFLMDQPIRHIALENPVGMLSSLYRPADQYVQPWQFGHGEIKSTGLWLKGLPPLRPTDVLPEVDTDGASLRVAACHRMSPGPERQKLRSRTYTGIAAAMAAQWNADTLGGVSA